jgi:glycosyltransferase involved in cell wall biosynthesis
VETPIVLPGRYHIHFYPFLERRLNEINPDLVHVDEEPYNLATYLALRIAKRRGARRLFYTWQNLSRRLPPPFGLIERANFGAAQAAIAANLDAANVLRAKGFSKLISVIPPGLDPLVYRPGPTEPSSTLRVGYVGRLVWEKGVDILLRACATLPFDWTLTVIGEGDQAESLAQLADRLGVGLQIAFEPPRPSGEIPDVLRRFDVLVLPSRGVANWREQFGRVLMEAMASEVAVIGSTCGEIPRVIGDAGLVFAEGNVKALAVQLGQLQSDPSLRASLARRGRQRVLDHFTLQRIAEMTAEVYRSLEESST